MPIMVDLFATWSLYKDIHFNYIKNANTLVEVRFYVILQNVMPQNSVLKTLNTYNVKPYFY